MLNDLNANKAALRQQVRERLKALAPEERLLATDAICAQLRQSPIWSSAGTILCFAPAADEPDIWQLLEEALAAGKLVCLPQFNPETQTYAAAQVRNLGPDLRLAKFGIREPIESCPRIAWERLGLALVPGVAFDFAGRRLGRGRGFYDRLLANVRAARCGVAFDEQIVSLVHTGAHDMEVNYVVTPTRMITV